jgi:hypothetical protein
MTFEERQRAEEEIAGFISRNMTEAERVRWRGLNTVDKLVLMYGACAMMFDGHMGNGLTAEAQRELACLVTIRRLVHTQMFLEDAPAA